VNITYTYDLNDGKGVHTETKQLTIKTLAKTTPTVAITSPTKTQTSVGFGISVTDPDSLYTLTKIELIHANGTVLAESLDVRAFENLLSNNDYTVKITYTYDLNDGKGVHTETKEIKIHTDPKVAPVVDLVLENVTTSSISYSYTVTDVDNILATITLQLLDENGNVLKTVSNAGGTFDGLTQGTKYFVAVTFTYDLNDGCGTQTARVEQRKITAAVITYQSANLYTATIRTGESISFSVNLDHPETVTVTHVLINGQRIEVTKAGDTYYASFIPNLESGRYHLLIEKVYYTLFEESRENAVHMDTELSAIILGDISIAGVSLSNGKNYMEYGETVVGYIDFIGSEGYTIESVKWDDGTALLLTKISDTRYSFELSSFGFERLRCISYFTYSLDGQSTTKTLSDSTYYLFHYFNTSNLIEIRTPEELQAMTANGHYILMNDLDMTGFDWTPFNFYGYLDGNGYEIKNLTLNKGKSDSHSMLYAMFLEMRGTLRDIVLTNVNLDVTVIGVDNSYFGSYSDYIALIAGKTEIETVLVNCHVKGSISVVLKQGQSTLSRGTYIGGLVGSGHSGLIYDNCSFEGDISVVVEERYNGWLEIGSCYGEDGLSAELINFNATGTAIVLRNGKTYTSELTVEPWDPAV
jgi:hypothetical protein